MTSPDHTSRFCGLILAGGRARRLGGVEKGLQLWRGRPLVSWAADALRPHCSQLLISANRQHEAYRYWADEIVSDGVREDAGPLAGIEAGLQWAKPRGFAGVLVMPCDTPGVDAAIMAEAARLCSRQPEQLHVYRAGERLNPLHGYYPVHLQGALSRYLEAGGRRVEAFVSGQEPIFMNRPAADPAFNNLNRPEDWPDNGG